MKSIFKIALITFSFVVGASSIQAQKSMDEGYIQYEVTNIEAESMEAQMMKGTLINVYFNQKNTKMNVQMMGGMVTMDIFTVIGAKSSIMQMNMMGTKAQVDQPIEDNATAESNKPDFDISYDKSDTKEIAGEKCVKAPLVDKKTKESVEIYVANGLNAKVEMKDKMFPGLEGIPMEIIIKAQGMGVTITAQDLKKSVSDSDFELGEGYEKMTLEEFQKSMGGMGNFGF